MSIIKSILQLLLGEKKDEDIIDNDTIITVKKHKTTSQIINKLEKGNNGIFGDEYEEEEEDDDTNYRDKDKEAREKYIEELKKKNKEGNKDSNKDSGKKGNKNSNKDSKYGKNSSKNLGKESHYIFTVLKNMQLQMRIFRSRQRKAQRAVRRANFLRRQLRNYRFLLASHKRYMTRRRMLFNRLKRLVGVIIGKKRLMSLVNKRKINVKKAKLISFRVKQAKKQVIKAQKIFKRAQQDKEMKFKNILEAKRKSAKIKKRASRGIGF